MGAVDRDPARGRQHARQPARARHQAAADLGQVRRHLGQDDRPDRRGRRRPDRRPDRRGHRRAAGLPDRVRQRPRRARRRGPLAVGAHLGSDEHRCGQGLSGGCLPLERHDALPAHHRDVPGAGPPGRAAAGRNRGQSGPVRTVPRIHDGLDHACRHGHHRALLRQRAVRRPLPGAPDAAPPDREPHRRVELPAGRARRDHPGRPARPHGRLSRSVLLRLVVRGAADTRRAERQAAADAAVRRPGHAQGAARRRRRDADVDGQWNRRSAARGLRRSPAP